jgi:hypothetical protein
MPETAWRVTAAVRLFILELSNIRDSRAPTELLDGLFGLTLAHSLGINLKIANLIETQARA